MSIIELNSHLIMSKSLYMSGSEKRKRLTIQKENISKLPKLTSFFTLEETNKQTESSTSSYQENDTTSTSVLSSSGLNLDVNKSEIKSYSVSNCDLTHLEENISDDPGTYCDDILTEKKRDIWIRKGP